MSEALNASWQAIDQAAGDDVLCQAKAKALMLGYDAKWSGSGWSAIAVEETVQLPIVNPETGRASRTFTQAGKHDGICQFQDGRRYLLEHKTCGEEIEKPDSPYWRRLAIDSQVSMYMLQNWQGGEKLSGTLYDVIRKPTIRPKQIPKNSKHPQGTIGEIQSFGTYYGFDLHRIGAHPEDYEAGQVESPQLYCLRLSHDATNNPNRYYQRRTINRLDNEVLEWSSELWDIADAIRDARKRNAHYRNSSACMSYNTPCEYLGLCSGHDSEDSDNWERKEDIHSELAEITDSANTLTNSRINCFQLCRRKHFYRYELGLRRREDEEREALFFGSVFHAALEAWWSCYMEKSNGNCTDSLPDNESGSVSQASALAR